MKHVLTIAGSDCSGGAGIQADLKTFAAHGVYGMSVIVSVVAENTQRVIGAQNVSSTLIAEQLQAVFEDIRVDAIKIGMLPSQLVMETVRQGAEGKKTQKHCSGSCDDSKRTDLPSWIPDWHGPWLIWFCRMPMW